MSPERAHRTRGIMENGGDRLDQQRLVQAFARLKPLASGASLGIVAGGFLFLLTAVILLRGPAEPVAEVGPHLGLLAYYLPGYRVTWGGAWIGLLWGVVDGFVLGALLASFVNFHHALYLRLLERRFRGEGLING